MATCFLKDHTELPRIDEIPQGASIQIEVLRMRFQRPAIFEVGDELYVPDTESGTLTVYRIIGGQPIVTLSNLTSRTEGELLKNPTCGEEV